MLYTKLYNKSNKFFIPLPHFEISDVIHPPKKFTIFMWGIHLIVEFGL